MRVASPCAIRSGSVQSELRACRRFDVKIHTKNVLPNGFRRWSRIERVSMVKRRVFLRYVIELLLLCYVQRSRCTRDWGSEALAIK